MDLPLSYEPDVTADVLIVCGSFKGAIAHPLTSVFVPDSALGLLPSIALSSGQVVPSLDERIETGKQVLKRHGRCRATRSSIHYGAGCQEK